MKLKDWFILLIPIIVIAIVMMFPFIPEKIPMQFNSTGQANWYLPKWYFPIIGIFPFLIYKKYKKKIN